MKKMLVSVAVAFFFLVNGFTADIDILGSGTASPDDEYIDSWILVQLVRPIGQAAGDGSFPLETGQPAIDSLIRETGVHRIEWALPVSSRSPRDPEAFRRHGLDRTYRFHVPAGSDIPGLVERFNRLPGVAYAEPDVVMHADQVYPNDPLFPDQYGYDQPSDADMDGPEAWEVTTGGNYVLAILDTGIDSDHEDLAGKILPGYDFVNNDADPEDDRGHGTRVSSIAAANTDNSVGMAGGCWGCPFLPVKVLDSGGSGSASWFSDGLVWATDHGAHVANYSASGSTPNATRMTGINYAYDAGVVLAGGAGNGDSYGVLYPKARAEFIATGATDALDRRAAPWSCSGSGGSRYGKEIDFVLPADAIPAANMGGGYEELGVCGNSFSGPGVTGVIGLVGAVLPSAGREEIRHLLRSGAEDQVGRPAEDVAGFDIYHGWGRVNMKQTLDAAVSSASLRVDGKVNTRVFLETVNPVAQSYDFVRGDLSILAENWRGVDLGTVVCLEDDSPDADTVGNEDTGSPDPGECFYYVSRFNAAPGAGSYGGSSRHRDREVLTLSEDRWMVEGGQAGARFGTDVATAGDVNNDGFDDIIVGAELYDGDQVDEGAAFVYYGSASGPEASPAWSMQGDQSDSSFGWSVSTAGDINGDGFDDIIVGAPLFDNGETNEGAAFVYLGSVSGPATSPTWTLEGDQTGAWFGYSVASAGDVNNDGYDDVIVGAPLYDGSGGSPDTRPDRGRAFVFMGSSSGLATSPDWEGEVLQASAQFGTAVGSAGDVNNDGFGDVVIGAPLYDNGQLDEGAVFIYHGGSSGLDGSPTTTIEMDIASLNFGTVALAAGDVDGDGYGDVVTGAKLFTGGETEEGIIHVFPGSSAGVIPSSSWSYEGGQFYASLGVSAGTAGDVNNDGLADIVVGAELYDARRSDEGRALVFHGSGSGLPSVPEWSASPGWPLAHLGWRVAAAGDVNNDGHADVIVGARDWTNGEPEEGAAFVHLGSSSGLGDPAPTSDCGR